MICIKNFDRENRQKFQIRFQFSIWNKSCIWKPKEIGKLSRSGHKKKEKNFRNKDKSKGDLSYEIEIAVKKEKEKLMEKIENLKLENERKIFEINDLEMKLK